MPLRECALKARHNTGSAITQAALYPWAATPDPLQDTMTSEHGHNYFSATEMSVLKCLLLQR